MQGEETPGRVSKKFLKANARQLRRAEARSLKIATCDDQAAEITKVIGADWRSGSYFKISGERRGLTKFSRRRR